MKLTKEQGLEIINKLNEYWQNRPCEVCGNNKWELDNILFETREFHGPTTILGSGALKPFVTAMCANCGNTKFFNAIKLGVLDSTKPNQESKESAK